MADTEIKAPGAPRIGTGRLHTEEANEFADDGSPKIPLALHEAAVERFDTVTDGQGFRQKADDPAIKTAAAGLKSARAVIEAALVARKALVADATRPVADTALRVANLFEKTSGAAAKHLDAALAKLEGEHGRVWHETAAPKVDSAFGAELRGRIAAMPAEQRQAAVTAAIMEDQLEVVGAVLQAPGLASGLTPKQIDAMRELYRGRHHPGSLQRLDRLAKAADAVRRAGASLVAFDKSIRSTPESMLASESARLVGHALAAAHAAADGGA